MRKTLLSELSSNDIISLYNLLSKYDINDNRDLWTKKTSELLSIFLAIEAYQEENKFQFLMTCSNLNTILKFKTNINVSLKINNYLFSLPDYSELETKQSPLTLDQHYFLSSQPIDFINRLNNIYIDDIIIENNWFNNQEKQLFFSDELNKHYNMQETDIKFLINYFIKFEKFTNFDFFKYFLIDHNSVIAQFIINLILKKKFNNYEQFIHTMRLKIKKIDNKNDIYATIKQKNTLKKEIIKI